MKTISTYILGDKSHLAAYKNANTLRPNLFHEIKYSPTLSALKFKRIPVPSPNKLRSIKLKKNGGSERNWHSHTKTRILRLWRNTKFHDMSQNIPDHSGQSTHFKGCGFES